MTRLQLQLQRGALAASAPADARCRVCSSYGFFTPGPNSLVMLLHFQNRVVVSFFTLCFAGDAPSSAALPDVCDMPTAWEQLTTEFVPLMAFGLLYMASNNTCPPPPPPHCPPPPFLQRRGPHADGGAGASSRSCTRSSAALTFPQRRLLPLNHGGV